MMLKAKRHYLHGSIARLFASSISVILMTAWPTAYAQPAQAGAQQALPSQPAAMQLPPITPLPGSPFSNELPLYPKSTAKSAPEQWNTYLGGAIVRNVTHPTVIPMIPAAGKANGTAIIYAPGGGFKYLAMQDGELQKLLDQGVTVFLLKYRTDATDRDPKVFLTNLYGWLFSMVAKNKQFDPAGRPALHATPEALSDGLEAVRLVRSQAAKWGIDPHRIGFMGGSAGAATALDVAFTKVDSIRPDFVVSLYGPKRIDDVPTTAPPLFVAASVDDPLFPGSSDNVVAAWSKVNRPVEAHLYEKGGHGLPAGTTAERWFDDLVAWMKQHGWLSKSN